MSDGTGLAPTPIVRITAEQLEYLIGRVINRWDKAGDPALWQFQETVFAFAAPGLTQVLGINPNRVGFLASGSQTQCLLSSNLSPTTTQGMSFGGTTSPFPVMFEEYGYLVTRPWSARYTNVAAGSITIIEITTPQNLLV